MKRMNVFRMKLTAVLLACTLIPCSYALSSELLSDGDPLSDGGMAAEEENGYEPADTYDLPEEVYEEQAAEIPDEAVPFELDSGEEAVQEDIQEESGLLCAGESDEEADRINHKDPEGVSGTSASGKCGKNLTWTLSTEGDLTISGTGKMWDDSTAWWNHYRSEIKKIVIQKGATSIGDAAFYYCTNLTSIKIPTTVTSIGSAAFQVCESLTGISIPSSVKSIGEWSFAHCPNLKSIIIPKGVTSIEAWTFCNCKSLADVSIPNSVKSIGEGAFENCVSLQDISIPNSVISIGDSAFGNCSHLTSFIIPSGVKSMGAGVFYQCYQLKSVTIPKSVVEIGANAFPNNTVIYGYTDSYAQEYASSQNLKFIPLDSVIVPTTVIYKLQDLGSGNLRIYWRTRTDVDGYQIKWSKDPNNATGTKTSSHSARNNVIREGLDVGSTYYVQVRTYQVLGGEKIYSRWSGKKSLKLTRTLTGTSLSSVTKSGTTIKVSWKKTSGVEGYQVRFSDSASFTSPKTASAAGASKLSLSKGGFAKGKTWYVQVRTYKTASDGTRYYSPWSAAKSINL